MANEFTRITHHVSGATTQNINSSKATTGLIPGRLIIGGSTDTNVSATYLPVSGYKNLSIISLSSGSTIDIYWAYSDGTESAKISTLTLNTWEDLTIPDNAVCVRINGYYSSTTFLGLYYSLTN